MKKYSTREFKRILTKNGFVYVGCIGDHFKYKRTNETIVLTNDLNPMIARRLVKQHGLVL